MADKYTFGDNDRASARLKKLADVYEPNTREMLTTLVEQRPQLAVDMGCGPGWSTNLIHQTLTPGRTLGLEASERYVNEARGRFPGIEFQAQDVTQGPFPHDAPDLVFSRFLLTHFRDPVGVLAVWANFAAPGARLLLHETEDMQAGHPALRRYYELVAELQEHYGQDLRIGARLSRYAEQAGWSVLTSSRQELEKPGKVMAELHLENLRTWRNDAYASKNFDPDEINALEETLERIVSGEEDGGAVVNAARQIAAVRAV